MAKFLGVTNAALLAFSSDPEEILKRAALLFDEIALHRFYRSLGGSTLDLAPPIIPAKTLALRYYLMALDSYDYSEDEQFLRTLEWLREKGVFVEPALQFNKALIQEPDFARHMDKYREVATQIKTILQDQVKYLEDLISRIDNMKSGDSETVAEDHPFLKLADAELKLIEARAIQGMLGSRLLSLQLRELHGADAYPFACLPSTSAEPFPYGKAEAIKIVLSALPIPDASTPWESVLEFREDPETREVRWGLRLWMSEVARAKLSPIEIQEKLEWLLYQHKRYMQVHKLKIGTGVLEIIVTTASEVLEDLLAFRFIEAAKALFSFKRSQIALMEAEMTSPGKEVAYIFKAREHFAKKDNPDY